MTQRITKHWPISDIIELFPDSIAILMAEGLNCIGCAGASTERLNEGLQKHNFSEQEIQNLVERLNQEFQEYQLKTIRQPQPQDFQVTTEQDLNSTVYRLAGLIFTEQAYKALHELLENHLGLQIRLETGGCSGYNYIYDFVAAAAPDEQEFSLSPELKLFINNFTFDKLYGTIIDFKTGIKDAGLVFINPNTKNSCHCGSSVGF